jgi:hypothetical protein
MKDDPYQRSIFMHPFLENLKRQATENPMVALAVGGAVLAAVTKFLNVGVDMRNSHAWSREVARRAMKDGLK